MLPRMVPYGGEGLALRTLGRTGLEVTPLCVGSAPLGNTPLPYKQEVALEDALATIRRVLEGPINFLDTSNNYGDAERRIGMVLRERGLPDGFVLATKVDRDMDSGDFSADRVKLSVQESLERLGLDKLGLVHFHDPEHITFEESMAEGGPVEALHELKGEGVIAHIGVAGGPIDMLRDYVRTGAFDVVLTHNRYSLVDQSAAPLLDTAQEHGVAALNAAPFGGGILVGSKYSQGFYAYHKATPEILARVEALRDVCDRHGVPLAAAALQFSMREPRITATLAGCVKPEQVDRLIESARWEIPDELWEEL
jgi:D-threo-aldose 1-dehydrogenase